MKITTAKKKKMPKKKKTMKKHNKELKKIINSKARPKPRGIIKPGKIEQVK